MRIIKHKFQSAKSDGSDATLVRPSNWNDAHDLGFTPPTASMFPTWVNQGGATLTEEADALTLYAPANSGDSHRMALRSLTTLTAGIIGCELTAIDQNYWLAGLVLRESSSGKLSFLGAGFINGAYYGHASASGSTGSVGQVTTAAGFPRPIWFKLTYNGTTITYSVSMDGKNFIQMATDSNTAHFNTAPDQWGIFCASNNSNFPVYMRIFDCQIS